MTTDTLTETYQFLPAWFKGWSENDSIIDGIQEWWNKGPATAYADNDDENRTVFWAEALVWYWLVDLYLTVTSPLRNGDIPPSQVTAKRTHEAAHEPILGQDFEPLRDEGRSPDGGLNHVPEDTGDVMIPRGVIRNDTRGLINGYEDLVENGQVKRGFEVW